MWLLELVIAITGFIIGFTYIVFYIDTKREKNAHSDIDKRTNESETNTSSHNNSVMTSDIFSHRCKNQNTISTNVTKKNEISKTSIISSETKDAILDVNIGDSEWETVSSSDENDTKGEDGSTNDEYECDSEDSEWTFYAERNLKMVLVVRQDVLPKLIAREVAEYAATAAVEVVKLIINKVTVLQVTTNSTECCEEWELEEHEQSVRNAQNERRKAIQEWLKWYKWWKRIGCAKITLRCPDKSVFDQIILAVDEAMLPYYVAHRCNNNNKVNENNNSSNNSEAVVLAIGPAPSDVLNPITGKLKLLS